MTRPVRYCHALLLAATLVLASCGGGSNTAGAGGSGVGGTGITTISGNISQVVARATRDPATARRLLALLSEWVSKSANAQTTSLANIQVVGGDRITVTDASGNFVLNNVTPSQSFVLRFVVEGNQTISLPIGTVPAGTRVLVINVVLNVGQGFASAGDVQVQQNNGGSSDDDSDDGPSGSGGDDGNSMDDDASDDGDSADGESDDNSTD